MAVTLHDTDVTHEPIKVFIPWPELASIQKKVAAKGEPSLSSIILDGVPYKFTPQLKEEHPELLSKISSSFDLRTNVFDKLDGTLFFKDKPEDGNDYAQIFGLLHMKRVYRWIRTDYIDAPSNFRKYKVFVPKSNGSGSLGETLSTPLIGQPLIGHTQSFLSMGAFDTLGEAEACLKYIKTKLARVMLGVLKVTQHNPAHTWGYVALQDFTSSSDIDWSKSVHEIDEQLYKKYGLSKEEIEFIESHVKEMD